MNAPYHQHSREARAEIIRSAFRCHKTSWKWRWKRLGLRQNATTVPVGAVLVRNGEVVARNGNRTLELHDPSAHAEMLVIRDACVQFKSQRLPDCDLYVTLEPCAMCAGAISFARIKRIYIGAEDAKGGAVLNGPRFFSQATCHHEPDIYSGISELAAQDILRTFFKRKRS